MSEEGIKALLGTVEEPESEEYSEINIFEERDIDEVAGDRYDFIDLINSIGTPEFKPLYMLFKGEIYSLDKRRNLAREILDKLNEIYEIEYTLSADAIEDDVNDVFDFVEFLEYDYVGFISDVWKFMDVDLRSDIRSFCMRNADKILKVIEDQLETHYLSSLITLFLRTYNKDGLIMLFIKMTETAKMLITLNNLEENIPKWMKQEKMSLLLKSKRLY